MKIFKRLFGFGDQYRLFAAFFVGFLLVSILLFLSLIFFLFTPRVEDNFDQLQIQRDQATATAFAAQLKRYILDRELSLMDIADSQYITSAVLQNDQTHPAFNDYLNTARLLGEDPDLTVVNIVGELLWSEIDYSGDYGWVKTVLTGEDSVALRLINDSATQDGSQAKFEVAVPIIYGRGVEGVLIAHFSASPNHIFDEAKLVDGNIMVVYQKGGVSIRSSLGEIKNPHIERGFVERYKINVSYIRSWAQAYRFKHNLKVDVIYVTLLGAVIMFILLYVFGRQLLLRPYKDLSELQQAITEAVEGISRVDVDGRYVALNNAYANTAGYTPEELEGQPWVTTVYPEDIPMLESAYQTMLADGQVTAEARGIKKTGELFYKRVTMVSQYDGDQFVGHHCFMSDISARKQVEAEQEELFSKLAKSNMELLRYQKQLQEGKQELTDALNFQSFVFSSIPELVFVKDEQFRIVQANDAFLNLYPEDVRSSVIGTTTLEKYREEEAEQFLQYDRQAFAEGASHTEETILFPDGVNRILDTRKIRFEDSKGKQFILGIAYDITGLKETQRRLEESEVRYELAVKGAAVGLWDYDVIGGHLFWSDRFKAIVGIDDKEFSGRLEDFSERLHPEDKDGVLEALSQHMENKAPYNVEYRFRHAEGHYIWLHAKGQAVWDEQGNAIRMAGSVDDISDKKMAVIERERLIDKLAQSNEWLEQFAFACSHDLQEPLRMVRVFSKKLSEHLHDVIQDDEKAKHYFEYVEQGAATSQELITDILAYSRIDRDHDLLQVVDVNQLVQLIADALGLGGEGPSVELTWDALPTVTGNKTQLQQLFQNLINNGLKYQQAGKVPAVHISAEDSGDHWTFSIKDNGIGIAPRYQQQIFDVFKRLHTRSEYSGSGIGLAICRKVVERCGGKIWVESELGQGATFLFTFKKLDAEGGRGES